MSMKDRLASLEARRLKTANDLPSALVLDMEYIFENYGLGKIFQIARADEIGGLSDDNKALIKVANKRTPTLQKEGGMLWLCRTVLRLDRDI